MQKQPYCSGQIMSSLIVTSPTKTDQGVSFSGLWEQRGAPLEITDIPEVASEIASLTVSPTPTLFLGTLIFKFFHLCPQIFLLLLHPSSASSPAFVLVRINASTWVSFKEKIFITSVDSIRRVRKHNDAMMSL